MSTHWRARKEPTGEGIPLFAPHAKVYPRGVKGPIRRIKWLVLIVCLTLYYVGPWLRWDRGVGRPDQALLIDLPGRRAYFFWIEIWPHEVYYLTGLLIIAAVGLFLVTSLFGRVWCGYACPQTVWTDLFMWAERLTEGDRAQRIRLDQQPLSFGKAARKTAKHAIWVLIALATGGAWVMYFNDAPTLARSLVTFDASLTQYFFIGLFTATTYLLAGWAREQVCTYMCPWPRIQSAMIDEDTLAVTYRAWRGEPRGKYLKGQSWEGRGDCIDCHACVAVCPTGIDIRDGSQLECIGCGLCIDACNDIMQRISRPQGLIGFDTFGRQAAGKAAKPRQWHLVRARTIAYVAVLLIVTTVMIVALASRSIMDVSVLADRSPLYVRLSDGSIRDGYTVKIQNKAGEPRSYIVTAEGLSDATLLVAELTEQPVPVEQGTTLTIGGDSIGTFRIYVKARDENARERGFAFIVRDRASGEAVRHAATFRGPEH